MSKKFGIPERELKRDLPKLEAYQMTVPERRRDIKYSKITANPKDEAGRCDQLQGDLLDVEPKKAGRKLNKGVRFLLLYIDVFSRKMWGYGLKTKNKNDILKYSKKVLLPVRPHNITFDREAGLRTANMRAFLKHHDIRLWHPERKQPNKFKGATSIIERANRTIRGLITKWKVTYDDKAWIDKLPALLANYNNTVHGAFKNKKTPNDVWESNSSEEPSVRKVDTYVPGTRVRVRQTRKRFEKGSNPSWSQDIYTVDRKAGQKYFVKEPGGQKRKYRLGPQDLKRVPEDVFAIRKSKRGKRGGLVPASDVTYLSKDVIRKPATLKNYFKLKPRRAE
jgi:hypothetical protein